MRCLTKYFIFIKIKQKDVLRLTIILKDQHRQWKCVNTVTIWHQLISFVGESLFGKFSEFHAFIIPFL